MSIVLITLIQVSLLFLTDFPKIVSCDVFDSEDEKYPKGGILIQLTKPGLESVIFAAETATGTILKSLTIPDVNSLAYSLTDFSVESFDAPKYEVKSE